MTNNKGSFRGNIINRNRNLRYLIYQKDSATFMIYKSEGSSLDFYDGKCKEEFVMYIQSMKELKKFIEDKIEEGFSYIGL